MQNAECRVQNGVNYLLCSVDFVCGEWNFAPRAKVGLTVLVSQRREWVRWLRRRRRRGGALLFLYRTASEATPSVTTFL